MLMFYATLQDIHRNWEVVSLHRCIVLQRRPERASSGAVHSVSTRCDEGLWSTRKEKCEFQHQWQADKVQMVLKAAYVKLLVPNIVMIWREMLVPIILQLGVFCTEDVKALVWSVVTAFFSGLWQLTGHLSAWANQAVRGAGRRSRAWESQAIKTCRFGEKMLPLNNHCKYGNGCLVNTLLHMESCLRVRLRAFAYAVNTEDDVQRLCTLSSVLLLCVPSSYIPLQQPTSGNDYEAMRPQCKSLAVSLSTVSQLVGSFRHTYKEELQPWTTKDAPIFSGVHVWLVTLLGCERCRGTCCTVLRLVKIWCTFVPFLCNVCRSWSSFQTVTQLCGWSGSGLLCHALLWHSTAQHTQGHWFLYALSAM